MKIIKRNVDYLYEDVEINQIWIRLSSVGHKNRIQISEPGIDSKYPVRIGFG